MQLEIWSDIACPWCAVGKRRLGTALAAFEHRDEVEVRWRSFELDPSAPARQEGDYVARLATKYGTDASDAQAMIDRMTATAAEDGWAFDFARIRPGNTFDAHRVLHLAADRGVQDHVKERFLSGYLEGGVAIGDHGPLTDLAVGAGLDRAEVTEVLGSDRYADAVRADEQQAAAFGIGGVPFFVLDRTYAVEGAQPVEVLLGALRQAHGGTRPLEPAGHGHAPGDTCADGSCAI